MAREVTLREQAERDIEAAIEHYVLEGGSNLAIRFIDDLEASFDRLAATSHLGSPRYALELDLPDLRHWPLKHFPYLIFYVVTTNVVDVWRVLHAKRDIPPMMQFE